MTYFEGLVGQAVPPALADVPRSGTRRASLGRGQAASPAPPQDTQPYLRNRVLRSNFLILYPSVSRVMRSRRAVAVGLLQSAGQQPPSARCPPAIAHRWGWGCPRRLPAPAAHYLLPFGARSRFLFKMDFAEAEYIARLRSGVKGHFSYREIAWQMKRKAGSSEGRGIDGQVHRFAYEMSRD